jgi:hypothetical protein
MYANPPFVLDEAVDDCFPSASVNPKSLETTNSVQANLFTIFQSTITDETPFWYCFLNSDKVKVLL